jgi:DeoR/GlpR family transcriptional regulator of sugar metabolism
MAMSDQEIKDAIIEKALKNKKAQLYVKDFYKCAPDAKARKVKNLANELVTEGKMVFFSSGSTTMYVHADRQRSEEVN